jgi:hypothetical protein
MVSSSCPPGHAITFFVRYQLPNRPEHVLRQGAIEITPTLLDTTPPRPVLARVIGDRVAIDLGFRCTVDAVESLLAGLL